MDDLDSKKFINQPENLRLQYSQIMENHRLHHRGSINLVLMYLAINGVSIKVVTGDGNSPFMVTLIIICNIALCIGPLKIFKKQIRLVKFLLVIAKPNKKQIEDFDFLYVLGELFTLVVYGQLILENVIIKKTEKELTEQIFNFMIRDFSKYALQLFSKTSSTMVQKKICRMMIFKPQSNDQIFNSIYKEHVLSLVDEYEMNK